MISIKKELSVFGQNAVYFSRRCTKPANAEIVSLAKTTALGCAALGGIGFFVKLAFIPINWIILGGRTV